MVYSVLEFLSIIANAVAILTGLILTLTVLVKSIYSKSAGMKVNAEDFSGHDNLFDLVKSCARCGFVFQLFAWLMFSANQIGFIQISTLTYYHAISWAVLCIVTLVLGIISRFITGKETSNLIIGRKVTWMMFYSILYFIVTFLVY